MMHGNLFALSLDEMGRQQDKLTGDSSGAALGCKIS
jgi:hypothetical protein